MHRRGMQEDAGLRRKMTDESTPRPPRRKRYQGKNPRRFEEKYKEHEPERFGETVAKVLASGKTPAGSHVPVMVDECLEALELGPGMVGVDCTLGYGGHARAILGKIQPGGKLLGMDQDPLEVPRTVARMRQAGYDASCFIGVRSNYAGILKALAGQGWESVDFIFADLGCSSMQLDDPGRGFSFKHDGPLDMRMNPNKGLPAGEWLRRCDAAFLETTLIEHSDESHAAEISLVLAGKCFTRTLALSAAIRASLVKLRLTPDELEQAVRRVFQALRIAVNEEFAALDAFLRSVPSVLKPGGRLAILSFHSGEDRRVKKAFQVGRYGGIYREVSDGVGVASAEERRMNARSSPAKLRWAIRG